MPGPNIDTWNIVPFENTVPSESLMSFMTSRSMFAVQNISSAHQDWTKLILTDSCWVE
jgi:hypothetical protein